MATKHTPIRRPTKRAPPRAKKATKKPSNLVVLRAPPPRVLGQIRPLESSPHQPVPMQIHPGEVERIHAEKAFNQIAPISKVQAMLASGEKPEFFSGTLPIVGSIDTNGQKLALAGILHAQLKDPPYTNIPPPVRPGWFKRAIARVQLWYSSLRGRKPSPSTQKE